MFPIKGSVNGLAINFFTKNELVDQVVRSIAGTQSQVFYYVNLHTLNLAWHNSKLREVLSRSDNMFCDGFGVWLLAKFQGIHLTRANRVTWPDIIDPILGFLEKGQNSVFFILPHSQVLKSLKIVLKDRFPTLRIDGLVLNELSLNSHDSIGVIDQIRKFGCDLLFIGFGSPVQELWIDQNMKELNTKIILPVGACFEFYTGFRFRAPRFMTDNGLEWLGRLISNPYRMSQRYIVGIPLAIFRWFLYRYLGVRPA